MSTRTAASRPPGAACTDALLSYALRVEPRPHFINWQQDPQGNHLARVVFPDRVTHFDVTVDLVADMATINPFDFFWSRTPSAFRSATSRCWRRNWRRSWRLDAGRPRLQALLDRCRAESSATVDFLVALNRLVQSRRQLHRPHGAGVQTPEETLDAGERLVPRFSAGCSCNCCAISVSPRASSPAI